jgi:hypothetical protein
VGAWISTHEFLRGLVRRGHEVDVVRSFARNGDYELDGVRVHASGWAGTDADVVSHLGDDNQGAKLAHGGASRRCGWFMAARPIRRGTSTGTRPTSPSSPPRRCATRSDGGGESIVAHPPIKPSEYATEHGDLVTLVNLHKHKGGKLFWLLARSMRDTEFLAVRGRGDHRRSTRPRTSR